MASIAPLSQVECAEVFIRTSEIQPHRQLQLSRSKRTRSFQETCRLLIISRIVSCSRRVLNELAGRIIEAIVAQSIHLIVAVEQIERLRVQIQMIPSAQIDFPAHP